MFSVLVPFELYCWMANNFHENIFIEMSLFPFQCSMRLRLSVCSQFLFNGKHFECVFDFHMFRCWNNGIVSMIARRNKPSSTTTYSTYAFVICFRWDRWIELFRTKQYFHVLLLKFKSDSANEMLWLFLVCFLIWSPWALSPELFSFSKIKSVNFQNIEFDGIWHSCMVTIEIQKPDWC